MAVQSARLRFQVSHARRSGQNAWESPESGGRTFCPRDSAPPRGACLANKAATGSHMRASPVPKAGASSSSARKSSRRSHGQGTPAFQNLAGDSAAQSHVAANTSVLRHILAVVHLLALLFTRSAPGGSGDCSRGEMGSNRGAFAAILVTLIVPFCTGERLLERFLKRARG